MMLEVSSTPLCYCMVDYGLTLSPGHQKRLKNEGSCTVKSLHSTHEIDTFLKVPGMEGFHCIQILIVQFRTFKHYQFVIQQHSLHKSID